MVTDRNAIVIPSLLPGDAWESRMTIVANDNNPPTPEGTTEKAINDNLLFKVHQDKE